MDRRDDERKARPASPTQGPQGVDKAPGEEASEGMAAFTLDTQKAKQKVDADISHEQERPGEKQESGK